MKATKRVRKLIIKGSYRIVDVVREKNKTVGNLIAPTIYTVARALDGKAYCLHWREYGPATELAMCNRRPIIKPPACWGCKVNLDEIAEEMGE